ncbi:MAG: carboxypeptidase regulatory-like domain-containing protein [Betaproteobacteria bacterium]|nr:carboxypeptidase regulatory-like domain-containing protein [Betaproteobacteria bacterium]
MRKSDRIRLSTLVLSVGLALGTLPALAQNTTAAVGGRITSTDGKPTEGASVTITHVESGTSNNVLTDANGRYSARGLRVGGPYTITITKGGVTEKRENVYLVLAETAAIDAVLGAPKAEKIEISAAALSDRFDSAAMGAGTNIGREQLAAQASIGRNLQDYARQDPRLAQTDKERGEISALGQNTRFNSITIDSMTTNDTFGLEANNLPTLKQPVSIDAIESVQVNLSNFDVTQKGYTGANINAVTKSGTNEFHGSVYFVTRDEKLAGKRFNQTTNTYFDAPVFKEETKGVTLGGPIIKDKLFFFASYEDFVSSRGRPNFGPIGSTFTNVSITQSAIDQAIGIARNTWSMDVGTSTVPQDLELTVKDTLLKLDWNINNDHRASVRYTKTEQAEPNLAGFSATGLSLSSWWYNQIKEIEGLVGQWFADWSPNLSTEVKLSKRDYGVVQPAVNGARLPAIGLRFEGTPPGGVGSTNNRFLNMGTELSRHFNVLNTKTKDAYFGGNWRLGEHEVKGGVDYADNDVFNAFLQNVNGNYTFGCAAGANTAAQCAAMTPEQRDAAVLENFRLGIPISYTVQLPLAGRTLADGIATWSYANTGLFLQDTWAYNPNLSFTFGVRVDRQSVPTKPIANPGVAAAKVAGNISPTGVITRDSGGFGLDNTVTLDGNSLLQPRFGFNLNLSEPGTRRQLRGGFGLFQGAAANVWLSNPFSNTGMAVGQLNCTTATDCAARNVRFSPNPDAQPGLTGTPPSPNVDMLASDLEQPSVWKMNLAFDTELPELPFFGKLTAGVEWIRTAVNSGIYYRHLNLGAPTATGRDGRSLYYTPQTYSINCWTGSNFNTTGTGCAGGRNRALSNPLFNNVFEAAKTKKGGGEAVTLSVERPLSRGWGWNLAYTYSRYSEVSPLTSSTSNSQWLNNNIFNVNENVAGPSNYNTRDRINGSFTWSKAFFGKNKTTFGIFYEGRSGKPYSWTYLNDLNGDGIGGNDLMYIPSAPGSGDVVFRGGQAEEDRFWEVVNGDRALRSARGGIVGKNNSYGPWVNTFDVRMAQELPGAMKGHKLSLVFDILNFGNMLNKKWGRIEEITFPSNRSFVNFNGLDANGRYIYSLGSTEQLVVRQASGESQWAAQMTLRYEF